MYLHCLFAALLFATSVPCKAVDFIDRLKASSGGVTLADGAKQEGASIKLERNWNGKICQPRLRNLGKTSLKIARINLFDIEHGFSGNTPFYAEAFQMLAQNGGTLAKPEDWGSYPDRTHYRMEEPEGMRTAHGMMIIRPENGPQVLLGFGSCRRFDGRFSFNDHRLLVSIDAEGLELAPGAIWDLDEFYVASGDDRGKLLDELCKRIEKNHPRRKGFRAPPMGWCSWYCFGPNVTLTNILTNLDWIAKNTPELRYIQIDDGYQPWMGDWLETGKSFGGDIKTALKAIRQKGFEPAIWVAPFVASPESKLFREHPEWFIKDKEGKPLRSDKVGFGGWRLGPWYALDGTHPDAQKFLENTFRIMRRDWGCTYFKLDANYWGTLHKGFFHDPKATRIEAYRRGMEAILRGTGNAFVLGCNHPLWPSLGLIDGSRSSMDTSRNWGAIRDIGRQNLLRGWQNGRFWWNDPDCVLLSPGRVMDNSGKTIAQMGLPENEVLFHAATIHATGGMLLSSDDLPTLTPERTAALKKLIPPTKQAASFENELLTVGRALLEKREYIYLFNWSDKPAERVVSFNRSVKLTDFWTDQVIEPATGEYRLNALPPHTSRLLVAEPARK